ncbi:hypothetical protein MARINOS108_20954 [Marinoscillum sp. 108]|nr:hypothetical protein MARINOS108_20954 [Marinoscillum sp. 108]
MHGSVEVLVEFLNEIFQAEYIFKVRYNSITTVYVIQLS